MRRELASKMYSPTTYYLGRFTSNMILQLGYPFIMIMTLFWTLGIDTSFQNYYQLILVSFLGNFVFCAQGYTIGSLINDENQCKLVNILIAMVMFGTNGALAN